MIIFSAMFEEEERVKYGNKSDEMGLNKHKVKFFW